MPEKSAPAQNPTTTDGGLHCVYGKCQSDLKAYPPIMCSPGCYFQGSATSDLEILRRLSTPQSMADCYRDLMAYVGEVRNDDVD